MTSITHAERTTRVAVVSVTLLLLAVAVATTTAMWRSMSAMPGTAMPGGWRLSMTWTPMHGGSWAGTAASFVTMWTVMMVPMMLPSVAPSLWKYHQGIARDCPHGMPPRNRATRATVSCVAAGLGYLAVWASLGAMLFPVGALLATRLVRLSALARVAPTLAAVVVIAGGAIQFTRWKATRLNTCRETTARPRHPRQTTIAAFRHGFQLGLACCGSCTNWMAILLVIGVMDPIPMLAVTGAISAERLSGGESHIREATGSAALIVGVILLARQRLTS